MRGFAVPLFVAVLGLVVFAGAIVVYSSKSFLISNETSLVETNESATIEDADAETQTETEGASSQSSAANVSLPNGGTGGLTYSRGTQYVDKQKRDLTALFQYKAIPSCDTLSTKDAFSLDVGDGTSIIADCFGIHGHMYKKFGRYTAVYLRNGIPEATVEVNLELPIDVTPLPKSDNPESTAALSVTWQEMQASYLSSCKIGTIAKTEQGASFYLGRFGQQVIVTDYPGTKAALANEISNGLLHCNPGPIEMLE